MENQNLEDRPIPGVTAKQLVIFLGGIISIIITVMATYYSLKEQNTSNSNKLELLQGDGKIRDEQIKTIQLQIQTIQLQIATMQAQYEIKNSTK